MKIEILLYYNNIFKHILNIFEYFVCLYLLFNLVHFIYEFNILPLLGENILGKINEDKITYQGKLIQFIV